RGSRAARQIGRRLRSPEAPRSARRPPIIRAIRTAPQTSCELKESSMHQNGVIVVGDWVVDEYWLISRYRRKLPFALAKSFRWRSRVIARSTAGTQSPLARA